MCIICYHPVGAELPDQATLKRCWEKNDDGAGFMWRRNDRVRVRKGFMSWGEFWAAYTNEVPKESDEFALHFRVSTAGGVEKGNCHPFPFDNNVNRLKATKWKSERAIMHNGILGKGEGSLSDTMLWIINEGYYLREVLGDQDVLDYLEKYMKGSKLMMFFDNQFVSTGYWYEDDKTGMCYSNWGYKDYERKDVVTYDRGGAYGRDDHSAWYEKWNGWGSPLYTSKKKDAHSNILCCVGCYARKNNLSYSAIFEEITCLVCGCKFDYEGEIIEWRANAWKDGWREVERLEREAKMKDMVENEDGVFIIDENEKIRCGDCNAIEGDYLVWDEMQSKWYCLSCAKYVC